MNKIQRIILGAMTVAFCYVCSTVPKQEYIRTSQGEYLRPDAISGYGSAFHMVESEYDYGYLISRGLLVLVCGGLLFFACRGKDT